MAFKIAMIGGGSYTWTPTLAGDLFLSKGLDGGQLALVDLDRHAAMEMQLYCSKLAASLGANWTVTVDEMDDALRGADVVCVSISTGGLAAMHEDYYIPEKYGVYHAVGDTVGPGGISRTLRNVPVFLDIARKMEVLCPEAWMVHVTNPLSQLTRAVARETSIQVVGLCHNYAGTISMLADYLDVTYADIDAVSVGVNHFTWLKQITCRGKPIEQQLSLERYVEYFLRKKEDVQTDTTDDMIKEALDLKQNMEYYFNFDLYHKHGYFPVGSSNHVAENLPYYCNDPDVMKKYYIRRKGVLPRRQILVEERKRQIMQEMTGKRPFEKRKASNELLAGICEALYTGCPFRAIVTMPNRGQIDNLPRDVAVETWAVVTGNDIRPEWSGDVPRGILGSMMAIIDEQELSVEAAITGDREDVYRAMRSSPLLQAKDQAEALADELLAANRQYLPQFF